VHDVAASCSPREEGVFMILRNILTIKGREVRTIGPDATLDDVVQELVRFKIGSLIVCEQDDSDPPHVLGIISERDILIAQAAHEAPLEQLHVRDKMTTTLITVSPDDRVGHAMGLMTEHRVRHLPVLEDGRLFGIISIGDVVKRLHDQLEQDNHYLRSYIRGERHGVPPH
jgi:CBS domain-containing protein